MNTNTDTQWQPVALVPASLSNDYTTTVEVVTAGPAVYIAALGQNGDSNDTRLTPQEARHLAQALLLAADGVTTLRLVA